MKGYIVTVIEVLVD